MEKNLGRFNKPAECPPDERPELAFDRKCDQTLRLRAEDEISLDSIFSDLLTIIEPMEAEMHGLKWNIDPREFFNAKQSMCFDEKLYISQMKEPSCKFTMPHTYIFEKEMAQVGTFNINVEESYDGFVVTADSEMSKRYSPNKSGHIISGKYDNLFTLIAERRYEYDWIDNARVIKTLEARINDYILEAYRETNIGGDITIKKALVNVKGRDNVFVLDGGIMLLSRFLVLHSFCGEVEYYSMNLKGMIMHCTMVVDEVRHMVRVYKSTFCNCRRVINKQYFNKECWDTSESFYTGNGHLVLNFWHNYNYIIHAGLPPLKPEVKQVPRLELMWKCVPDLSARYNKEIMIDYKAALQYLSNNQSVVDLLHDYVLAIIHYMPENVLAFTMMHFKGVHGERKTIQSMGLAAKKA